MDPAYRLTWKMRQPARVIIFTDDPGWHGARLKAAFARRGVEADFVSLRECIFDLVGSPNCLRFPGFDNTVPDGAFVRGVPGGTLEQVILRLNVLHALKALGVPVYNDGRAIERTVDKAMTSFVLAQAGIPAPATFVTESVQEAHKILMRELATGNELVIKPLFGSQGKGLRRISRTTDLPLAEEYDGVYYLQRFVGPGARRWHDWRVFVINGTAVSAMIRHGRTWISNVAQGARCEPVDLEKESDLRELAQRACSALEIDYAGVDLIRDTHGRLQVVEVNSIPAWKGLQSVSAADIAQLLVDDFLERRLPRPFLHSVA